MYNTTTDQNRAHRADLLWVKVGAEYIRTDGATIRKDRRTGRWDAFDAEGAPLMTHYGTTINAHSLTTAKFDVRWHEEMRAALDSGLTTEQAYKQITETVWS